MTPDPKLTNIQGLFQWDPKTEELSGFALETSRELPREVLNRPFNPGKVRKVMIETRRTNRDGDLRHQPLRSKKYNPIVGSKILAFE